MQYESTTVLPKKKNFHPGMHIPEKKSAESAKQIFNKMLNASKYAELTKAIFDKLSALQEGGNVVMLLDLESCWFAGGVNTMLTYSTSMLELVKAINAMCEAFSVSLKLEICSIANIDGMDAYILKSFLDTTKQQSIEAVSCNESEGVVRVRYECKNNKICAKIVPWEEYLSPELAEQLSLDRYEFSPNSVNLKKSSQIRAAAKINEFVIFADNSSSEGDLGREGLENYIFIHNSSQKSLFFGGRARVDFQLPSGDIHPSILAEAISRRLATGITPLISKVEMYRIILEDNKDNMELLKYYGYMNKDYFILHNVQGIDSATPISVKSIKYYAPMTTADWVMCASAKDMPIYSEQYYQFIIFALEFGEDVIKSLLPGNKKLVDIDQKIFKQCIANLKQRKVVPNYLSKQEDIINIITEKLANDQIAEYLEERCNQYTTLLAKLDCKQIQNAELSKLLLEFIKAYNTAIQHAMINARSAQVVEIHTQEIAKLNKKYKKLAHKAKSHELSNFLREAEACTDETCQQTKKRLNIIWQSIRENKLGESELFSNMHQIIEVAVKTDCNKISKKLIRYVSEIIFNRYSKCFSKNFLQEIINYCKLRNKYNILQYLKDYQIIQSFNKSGLDCEQKNRMERLGCTIEKAQEEKQKIQAKLEKFKSIKEKLSSLPALQRINGEEDEYYKVAEEIFCASPEFKYAEEKQLTKWIIKQSFKDNKYTSKFQTISQLLRRYKYFKDFSNTRKMIHCNEIMDIKREIFSEYNNHIFKVSNMTASLTEEELAFWEKKKSCYLNSTKLLYAAPCEIASKAYYMNNLDYIKAKYLAKNSADIEF